MARRFAQRLAVAEAGVSTATADRHLDEEGLVSDQETLAVAERLRGLLAELAPGETTPEASALALDLHRRLPRAVHADPAAGGATSGHAPPVVGSICASPCRDPECRPWRCAARAGS